MKILIIDDEPLNVVLLEELLTAVGYKDLKSVSDSRTALGTCDSFAPDLVLLDLHLPDLPGWEVLSRLQRDDATREIPVVVISADVTSHQINRLMAAGARAYLTKPFDMQEFFRIIEQTSAPASPKSVQVRN